MQMFYLVNNDVTTIRRRVVYNYIRATELGNPNRQFIVETHARTWFFGTFALCARYLFTPFLPPPLGIQLGTGCVVQNTDNAPSYLTAS